jgi:hypothetical protein
MIGSRYDHIGNYSNGQQMTTLNDDEMKMAGLWSE